MCEELEKITSGEVTRAIFNIPPGSMKSILLVMWRAWMWASNPRLRFLSASYSDHLSIRDNLKLRQIVLSEWYQKHYGVKLVDDQNQKKKFQTTEDGESVATSVNGLGTGEHPDFIIIDDPITAQQARSDVERASANDWFDRTISTRGVARDVRVVVIMQRLHQEDLSGHLLGKGGWAHTCFPMRYMPSKPRSEDGPSYTADPKDVRTEAGQLLWPSLFPEAKVRQLELDLGPYSAAGQLQQQPAPEGGGLFKREHFKFVSAPPKLARRARGWDTAGTENDGDYTAGVKISEAIEIVQVENAQVPQASGVFFIEHVLRGQWGPAGVDASMKQMAQADGRACAQREEKEGGSAGVAVGQARTKLLKGYDYKCVPISGDKVTRAKPFRAQVEAGNVYIVRTGDEARDAWIEPYIQELCDFPTGKNDDQVDGSSCAFNAVLLEPVSGGVLHGKVTW